MIGLDREAIIACADLVGRTGAKQFQIGYLHDDVPVEEAGWYAHAQLRGARITAENHRSPEEAADALSTRLLTGGQCQHCRGLVALSDDGAMAFDSTLATGERWTIEQQRQAGQCRWRRLGARWVRGCEPDGLVATIERAARTGNLAALPHLVMTLAAQDPDRAGRLLDELDVDVHLTRQQRRQLRRQAKDPR